MNPHLFSQIFQTRNEFNLSHNEMKQIFYKELSSEDKRIYKEWENLGWIEKDTEVKKEPVKNEQSQIQAVKEEKKEEEDDFNWFND